MNFILSKSRIRYNKYTKSNVLFKNKFYTTNRYNIKLRPSYITHSINVDNSINEITYYMVKESLLYVFFYCSLQWFYYKNLRKDDDKNKKK